MFSRWTRISNGVKITDHFSSDRYFFNVKMVEFSIMRVPMYINCYKIRAVIEKSELFHAHC